MRLEYIGGMANREPVPDVLRYYDRILPFYEREQESIPEDRLRFWRGVVRREEPARVLDLGAGLGRLTAVLSDFAPTVGIDVSVPMLRRAARLASGASFAAADMRRGCFGSRFDLITASSDPFCHLLRQRDRGAALSTVANLLTDRGLFVLEGLARRRRVFSPPPRRVRHAHGVLTIRESWRPRGTGQLWRAHYRYRDRADDGAENEVEATFMARAWDPSRIRPFFASCGLSVAELWGDFDRRPFGPDSARLLVAARRA